MVVGSRILQIKECMICDTTLVQILEDRWQGLKILQIEELVTLVIMAPRHFHFERQTA